MAAPQPSPQHIYAFVAVTMNKVTDLIDVVIAVERQLLCGLSDICLFHVQYVNMFFPAFNSTHIHSFINIYSAITCVHESACHLQ